METRAKAIIKNWKQGKLSTGNQSWRCYVWALRVSGLDWRSERATRPNVKI